MAIKNIGSEIPNLREFGAKGDLKADDTTAINAAIASLPQNASTDGGTIWVPSGSYLHEGPLNFKEKTGIRFIGAGALSGGGGIGVGRSLGATMFVYGGTGATRAWDFRSSVGCGLENIHCFAWGAGFTGPIWDLSGTEAKPTAIAKFNNSVAEATRAGGKPVEKILHCKGALLDKANECFFDTCIFSSCLQGVEGVSNAASFSVAHRFANCIFAGNQEWHLANPQEAWTLAGCTAESLFNDKGELREGGRPGFVGYSLLMQSKGLTLDTCWSGSNVPAQRIGANVEYRGEGLTVRNGSYNTGEIGIFLPEGPIGCDIKGVRFWKVNSGTLITGNTIDSAIYANRGTEVVELLTDTVKVRVGSIVQTANGAALLVS